jgi:hypothetical protein
MPIYLVSAFFAWFIKTEGILIIGIPLICEVGMHIPDIHITCVLAI